MDAETIREPRLPWLAAFWCFLRRATSESRATTLYEIALEGECSRLRCELDRVSAELADATVVGQAQALSVQKREIDWELEKKRLENAAEVGRHEVELLVGVLERNRCWVQADAAGHVAQAALLERGKEG